MVASGLPDVAVWDAKVLSLSLPPAKILRRCKFYHLDPSLRRRSDTIDVATIFPLGFPCGKSPLVPKHSSLYAASSFIQVSMVLDKNLRARLARQICLSPHRLPHICPCPKLPFIAFLQFICNTLQISEMLAVDSICFE